MRIVNEPIFICEDHCLSYVNGYSCIPLQQFKSGSETAVFVVENIDQLQQAQTLLASIDSEARAQSVVLLIANIDESVDVRRLGNVLVLRTESSFVKRETITFLAGNATARPPIELFFPPMTNRRDSTFRELAELTENTPGVEIPMLSCANLAAALKNKRNQKGIAITTLTRRFRKLYGVEPGRFLRVWRLLGVTNQLMRMEAANNFRCNGGKSALNEAPEEYRKSLKRAFGITYGKLLAAAKKKHWLLALVAQSSHG